MLPNNNFSSSSSSSSSSSTTPYYATSSSLPTSVVVEDDCDIITNMMMMKQKKRRGAIAILIPTFLVISCFGATVINQRRLQTYSHFPFQISSQQLASSWMEDEKFDDDDLDLQGDEDGLSSEDADWLSQESNPMQLDHHQEVDGGGGVGACLLIKDDNHWLVEWLAFHYHVMPLRHLIVVVDPQSKTSPLNILRRWTDSNLMTIDVWQDEDFMPKNPGKSMLQKYGNNTNLMNHRLRQGTFYMQCLDHFKHKRMGVSWVYLTDTDEFTSLNYNYHNNTHEAVAQQLIQQHPIEKPGSVLAFLREHQQQTSQVQTCLYLNRYMVGSAESSPEVVNKYATNGTQLLTQRFLKHKPKHSPVGKNMVHLDAMPYDDLMLRPDVHRVSKYCPSLEASTGLESSHYVKINHYIGTEEQFFFRTDPRATQGKGQDAHWQRDSRHYKRLGKDATITDTTSQAWIQGFVDSVGMELAKALLKGVGQVDCWKQYNPPRPRQQKQKTKKKKKTSSIHSKTIQEKQRRNHLSEQIMETSKDTLQQQHNTTRSHYLSSTNSGGKQDSSTPPDITKYAVGDQVYKLSKLKTKFSGPYTIEQLHTEDDKVTLRLSPKVTQTIDIGLIRRRRPKKKKQKTLRKEKQE